MLPNPHLSELKEFNAIRTNGHYVLTGGLHSAEYVEKEEYLKHPVTVARFTDALAVGLTHERKLEADLVLGADGGGAMLALFLAFQLTQRTGREVLAGYVRTVSKEFERIGATAGFVRPKPLSELAVRPAYEREFSGRRVVLIEDVVTLGGTMRRLAKFVRDRGGTAVAVVTPVDRGGLEKLTDIPVRVALVRITNTLWDPPDLSFLLDPSDAVGVPCPRCLEGIPVNTDLGHGVEFLARQASQPHRTQRS
jgi:orotate phosphoribosyltransferase